MEGFGGPFVEGLGRARRTLELLAGEWVRLIDPSMVSRETIRRRLAGNELKPWPRKMWCIPKVDAKSCESLIPNWSGTIRPGPPDEPVDSLCRGTRANRHLDEASGAMTGTVFRFAALS
jgi:hypothetical protein